MLRHLPITNTFKNVNKQNAASGKGRKKILSVRVYCLPYLVCFPCRGCLMGLHIYSLTFDSIAL